MYLLDTDTLTHLHAGHPNVRSHLSRLQDLQVATTIITKIEMLRGRIDYMLKANTSEDLLRAQRLFLLTETLLSQSSIISFDQAAAQRFEKLTATRKLRKVGRADLLIASIALTQRATLVTRNLRHFRQIPGLTVANWVDKYP